MTTETKPKVEKSEEPVVFSSLSQLMEEAGTLPDQNSTAAPKVVEADMSFSVMSPQEYEESKKSEAAPVEQPVHVFQGHHDVFSDDEEDDADSVTNSYRDDENEWMDVLDPTDDHMEQSMPAPAPRAFMRLWTALSEWITPEGAALVEQWRGNGPTGVSTNGVVPMVDRSDVGASRCMALMSMVDMHLQRGLRELQEDRERLAKQRLADFLRSLNYSRPTPRLDTRMYQSLTIILLHLVLELDVPPTVPAPISAVGITMDEYRYLAQSILTSLSAGSA